MRATRRRLLSTGLASLTLPLFGPAVAAAEPPTPLEPTPSCGWEEPTIAQTEGPFFKPGTSARRDLAGDAPEGERITLAGFVLDTSCRPVPGALVELWHADGEGEYDNRGFRFRGHQLTDGAGRWWFDTIVPAYYPGRTRHYHVKVQRPGGRLLTTQLYFPDEPRNRRDGLFDERLVLAVSRAPEGPLGRFDFVV